MNFEDTTIKGNEYEDKVFKELGIETDSPTEENDITGEDEEISIRIDTIEDKLDQLIQMMSAQPSDVLQTSDEDNNEPITSENEASQPEDTETSDEDTFDFGF